MALVQHLLDGIKQRCALGAKPVLQCPVGAKEMPRQRAAPRVGRALTTPPTSSSSVRTESVVTGAGDRWKRTPLFAIYPRFYAAANKQSRNRTNKLSDDP